MGKLEINKRLKESTLLNTAFEHFTTKGFSKTSISDIVASAGVAKGTFYLYFKDKYDIRNKLISHKSSQLFRTAVSTLERSPDWETLCIEEKIVRVIDNIIEQLNANQALLNFISKNLSWGLFKNALTSPVLEDDVNFADVYEQMLEDSPYMFRDPETMLFLIIELVSGACYSAILYQEPCSLEQLKPDLYGTIRLIIRSHQGELKPGRSA
ncbi:MAG: TetR/AcrR family transcriptional regulator [Oscillospiraceae bacterium]|nr:TetR/AcrR family transcriptional regulator [Oscillospiraceae bacterium]